MNFITQILKEYYSQRFEEFGSTPEGVDWNTEESVNLRYEKMMEIIDKNSIIEHKKVSILDVGCGYGGLYQYAKNNNIYIDYTGIDVCENMIQWASANFSDARFYTIDIFDFDTKDRFDYVVCNGILTQKLTVSIVDMDKYTLLLIKKMFDLCNIGIVFNTMTTKVNFMTNNLYYKNPIELFAFCFIEITKNIKLDHTYPLYEYCIYLYKEK